MDSILQVIIIFGAVGIIASVVIVGVYLLIAVINKKFNLDSNGHRIQTQHPQQSHQIINNPPQQIISPVINIDRGMFNQQTPINNIEQPSAKKHEVVLDDIPPLPKNPKDVKVETSFGNKRLGQQ